MSRGRIIWAIGVMLVAGLLACGNTGETQREDQLQLDGVQLIDELISCDSPGWDRPTMLLALEDRGKEYAAFLREMLDNCRTVTAYFQTHTPYPTATPEPLSPLALGLLAHYHQLLSFKDNPEFHVYCYAIGGPYNAWAKQNEELGDPVNNEDPTDPANTYNQVGIFPTHLWQMGLDYCHNQGAETDWTLEIKGMMKPHWVAALPPILPTATPTTNELVSKICMDFRDILVMLEGTILNSDQKMDYLLEEGFTREELQALAADCSVAPSR